jgi:nitrate/nitrite transporter NarK
VDLTYVLRCYGLPVLRNAALALVRPVGLAIVVTVCLVAWPAGGWLANRFGGTRRSAVWFLIVTAVVVAVTVAPDGREAAPAELAGSGLLVDQLTSMAGWSTALAGIVSTGERLANVALFVPVGFFGFAVFRSMLKALGFGALLSAGIETVQAMGERSGDLNDLVSNTVGGGLGALAAFVVIHLLRSPRQRVEGRLAGRPRLGGVARDGRKANGEDRPAGPAS